MSHHPKCCDKPGDLRADSDPAAAPPPGPQTFSRRVWRCTLDGGRAGLRTARWLLSIMVPVSLAVSLLNWLGWLKTLTAPLEPLFSRLGLPSESVIAFVTAACLNIYSGIAALAPLALTDRQITLLAFMMLVSHNFPIEAIVQRKAGTAVWRTMLLRLMISFVGVAIMNWLMPHLPGDLAHVRGSAPGAVALSTMLLAWARTAGLLIAQVIVLVTALMILQRLLKEFSLIPLISRLLYPVLWLLGLSRRCAFLWIVANTLGLAYGGAVIIEEVRQKSLTWRDAQLLNRSIAICHSLLEDTLLFMAIGAWAFWITVPRLAFAAAAVWLYRLVVALTARPAGQPSLADSPD